MKFIIMIFLKVQIQKMNLLFVELILIQFTIIIVIINIYVMEQLVFHVIQVALHVRVIIQMEMQKIIVQDALL